MIASMHWAVLRSALKLDPAPAAFFHNNENSSQPSHRGAPLSGESVYDRCKAFHSLRRNRTGPKHCGLSGRKSGTVNGFDYSDAMRNRHRNRHIVWNVETLDTFLNSPITTAPGTTMG